MFEELLNKMKLFKKFCVAVKTGNMYKPWVIEAMKRDEEIKKHQKEEKIKYAKGGVIEPLTQKFEIDEGEIIISVEKLGKECVLPNNDFMHEVMTRILVTERMKENRRMNTNNWRKMHGLPMRRKAGRRKSIKKWMDIGNRCILWMKCKHIRDKR